VDVVVDAVVARARVAPLEPIRARKADSPDKADRAGKVDRARAAGTVNRQERQ
jgi:hypothetical protein